MLGSGRDSEYSSSHATLLTVATRNHHDAADRESPSRYIILPVGIDYRMGIGKNFRLPEGGTMMVSSRVPRMGQGIMGEYTAIQVDQQVAPALSKFHACSLGP